MTSTAKQKNDFSAEVEQSVLGSLLIDNSVWWKIKGDIQAADFHITAHKKIFRALAELIENDSVADIVTVCEYLDRGGELTDAGGFDYVATLANNTPGTANAKNYAELVAERAQTRRAKLIFQNAITRLEASPLENVVTSTMASLQSLAHSDVEDVGFDEALDKSIKQAQEAVRARRDGAVLGVSTTLPTIDKLTGGLHGPKMIVLGGRPSTYKSALAWRILLKAAKQGKPCGILSLEMDDAELASRAIASEFKIDGHDFTSGYAPAVRQAESMINDEIRGLQIRIDARSNRIGQIVARIIEWRYKYNVEIVVIDHIQLVHHEHKQNRFLELSDISRQVKLLCMRLNMPIIILSQLSRDVDRENRRPRDSDLRECGNLEQDADIIMFTHCQKNKGQEADTYELILSKQRSGAARQIIDLTVNGPHFFVGEQI